MIKKEIDIETISIEKVIEKFGRGQLAIPEFQRDYVWRPNKAPKLLESLINYYPVGALLTWSSQGENISSRVKRRVLNPTEWIIDGQQRVTTLAKIMDGEIPLLFSIKDRKFLLESAVTQRTNDPYLMPVSEIWYDSYRARKVLDDLSITKNQHKEYTANIKQCADLLRYEIPLIALRGHTLTEATEAFQRINTQGIRLKSSDIESASLTIRHKGFIQKKVQPFLNKLKAMGWDRIHLSQLFLACEGIAEFNTKSTGRVRLHNLTSPELNNAWISLEKGVTKAIQMLNDELGIQDMSLFPSGNMLMPLAILHSPSIKAKPKTKEIVKWLINASVTKRYSGSAKEKLDQDILACFKQNPMLALNRANKASAKRKNIKPNESNLKGPLHDKYALFLTYLACRFSGMRDLFDGRKIGSTSSEKHHIIPRASVAKSKRRSLDNTANIAFILGETNLKISNKQASEYLLDISTDYLSSQCIPDDKNLYKNPEKFMKARARLMSKLLTAYLKN